MSLVFLSAQADSIPYGQGRVDLEQYLIFLGLTTTNYNYSFPSFLVRSSRYKSAFFLT